MVKRRETRTKGAGITRHQQAVTVFDTKRGLTQDEADELIGAIRAAGARPLWDKEKIVEDARRRLAAVKEALPADHDDMDFLPHDDFGWYYCELIKLDRIVRSAIAAGDAGRAALFAEDFGTVHRELQIKEVWEPDALAGRASREGAHRGPPAKASSQAIAAKHEQLLAEYAIRRLRMDDVPARQHAARAAGYSEKQAKRIIDGNKKNGHNGANVR